MGTWIEIRELIGLYNDLLKGRSLRGNVDRNIKAEDMYFNDLSVVPYVGTWIEMSRPDARSLRSTVVPYVGTWIEIVGLGCTQDEICWSFPTWERG